MFKEVHLKRGGWHERILRFTFPEAPHYQNFCPYFWLTILAMLLSPFALLWKGLLRLFRAIDRGLVALDNLMYDRWVKTTSRVDIMKAVVCWVSSDVNTIELPKCEQKRYERIRHRLRERISMFGLWESQDPEDVKTREQAIAELKKSIEVVRERHLKEWEEKEKAEMVKKARYATMVNVSKWLLPVLLVPVVLFVGYWFIMISGWILYWVWYGIVHADWMYLLVVFGGAALVVGVAVGLVIGGITLFTKTSLPEVLCKFGARIGRTIHRVANGVGSFFGFFIEMFKSYKQNHCPPIRWED